MNDFLKISYFHIQDFYDLIIRAHIPDNFINNYLNNPALRFVMRLMCTEARHGLRSDNNWSGIKPRIIKHTSNGPQMFSMVPTGISMAY